MRLKLLGTSLGAPAVVVSLPPNATVRDVRAAAQASFAAQLGGAAAELAAGFPHPRVVPPAADAEPAGAHGLSSGSTVDVRRGAAAPPPPPPPPAPIVVVDGPDAADADDDGPWACAACTYVNARAAPGCEVCGTERPAELVRLVVPADNACLFSALGAVTEGGRLDRGPAWRARVCALIAGGAAAALGLNDAELGAPAREYAAKMAAADAWGGGVELAVAAAELRAEVVAIETRTGRPYVFGEGAGYARRHFLIFDGVHYDALLRPSARAGAGGAGGAGGAQPSVGAGSGAVGVFDAADEAARASALRLVRRLRRAHDFVDLTGFTLKCAVCGAGVRGQADAVAHAKATAHSNFEEFSATQPAATAARGGVSGR